MTKNTEESDQEVVNEELPAPKFTSPSGDSQSSQPVDVSSLAKEVAELLRPTIATTVQSVKDKRFSELDKIKESMSGNSTLETLQSLGVEITPEIKDRLLWQRLDALEKQGVSSGQQSAAPVVTQTADWSKVIDNVGLDDRIPEVIELINGTYNDIDHFELAARRLKDKLSNATPLPAAQQAILSSGKPQTSSALTDEEVRAKEAELQELYRVPSKYSKRIAMLEEELEPYWTSAK